MDCLQTVSELYMYISSVSLPVNEPYQKLVSLRQSNLCGYDTSKGNTYILLRDDMLHFFVGGGGAGDARYAS